MLGSFAVGKTSLVRRFVTSLFSEKYQTTVGVKIDKKELTIDGSPIMLVLWDLAGEDEFQKVRRSYLRGCAGYLLVADGTRPATIDTVLELHRRAVETVGDAPFALLVNKNDLEWELPAGMIEELSAQHPVLRTSALTGEGVDAAFTNLARGILAGEHGA
jgi:hypothetical protein